MAKKKRTNKSLLGSLKNLVSGSPARRGKKPFARKRKKSNQGVRRRDILAPFQLPRFDLDPIVHPSPNQNPWIPPKVNIGTLIISQRHSIKCIILEPLLEADISTLKRICLRKLRPNQAIFLPMGTRVLSEDVLHQDRTFVVKLSKGTIFFSPGGHPNGYLLSELSLPLRRELGSILNFLPLTEIAAQQNLQKLIDIPESFSLLKEDNFYNPSETLQKAPKVPSSSTTVACSQVSCLMTSDCRLKRASPTSMRYLPSKQPADLARLSPRPRSITSAMSSGKPTRPISTARRCYSTTISSTSSSRICPTLKLEDFAPIYPHQPNCHPQLQPQRDLQPSPKPSSARGADTHQDRHLLANPR